MACTGKADYAASIICQSSSTVVTGEGDATVTWKYTDQTFSISERSRDHAGQGLNILCIKEGLNNTRNMQLQIIPLKGKGTELNKIEIGWPLFKVSSMEKKKRQCI